MLIENCKLAIISIKANKVRAFLTMLGIIIGVASVIAIMTVGNSMTKQVSKEFGSFGVQNIGVYIEQKDYNEEISGPEEDLLKIKPETIHEITNKYGKKISAISVDAEMGSATVRANNKKANVSISGVSAGYFKANNIKLLHGNYFDENAYKQGSRVAIVSEKFAKQVAGEDYNPEKILGKEYEFNINDDYFYATIVGIYEYKPDKYSGPSKTSAMYVPLKTAWNYTHDESIRMVTVVAAEETDPVTLGDDMKSFLTKSLASQLGEKFMIMTESNKTMVDQITNSYKQMTVAISVIAGIALIVGGIGVMNIMTVSITERTREIGTRKALGAPDSMIMLQFISEAIILCLIGGLIGMTIGVALGELAAKLMNFSPTISLSSIYISVGFSMAIGVFFGYSPAKHAAKMNPIDALRYE